MGVFFVCTVNVFILPRPTFITEPPSILLWGGDGKGQSSDMTSMRSQVEAVQEVRHRDAAA